VFTYVEMAAKRQNKKQDLIDATVRLVAKNGVRGTTVRSIAREAGVTEAALYRHYASKAELCLDVYTRIVTDMIRAKEAIAFSDAPVRDKLREWVRVSYEFFDRHADAFTFVLLTPHDFSEAEREVPTRQGEIFVEMVKQAQAEGQIRPVAAELALSHFSGVMLSVSRLINEGVLDGPASKYTDDVADAIWRMLEPEPSRTAGSSDEQQENPAN
jgi:AcrR family transcriptional regulator